MLRKLEVKTEKTVKLSFLESGFSIIKEAQSNLSPECLKTHFHAQKTEIKTKI
jgi:hypothetical protein